MNHEEMSDFQINKRVASKLGLTPLTYPHDADMRSVGVRHSDTWYEWFDYCNNPSDAWPIILVNNISITKCLHLDEWEVFGGGVLVDYEHCIISECGCFCSNKNPLRAAMIVFLMMQDQAK